MYAYVTLVCVCMYVVQCTGYITNYVTCTHTIVGIANIGRLSTYMCRILHLQVRIYLVYTTRQNGNVHRHQSSCTCMHITVDRSTSPSWDPTLLVLAGVRGALSLHKWCALYLLFYIVKEPVESFVSIT